MTDGKINRANLLKTYNYTRSYVKVHGKKGPEAMFDMYDEIYILGVDYVTKKEMKKKSDAKWLAPLSLPDGVPPLSEPLLKVVEKMTETK